MNNGIAKRGFGRAMMKKGGYLQSPVINSVKPKPTKPKPKVVEVRDINKNGKKDGFEVARAKGMAKGMGAKVKLKSGGIIPKSFKDLAPDVIKHARNSTRKKLGKNATSEQLSEGTAKELKKIKKAMGTGKAKPFPGGYKKGKK